MHSAHGVYPVPAPATARLLKDAPIYVGPQKVEMVTPTGALLVTGTRRSSVRCRRCGSPRLATEQATATSPTRPNVLRVLVGESDASVSSHTVVVIEAEIDDMNPQIFGVLMDRLLAQGALDVFYTPIQMKKNRPGTLLSVIAVPRGA